EVEENLLQLMRVGGNQGKIGGELQMHADLVHAQVIIAEGESVFHNRVDVDRHTLGLMLAREAQKILHDPMGALGLLVHFFGVTQRQRSNLAAGLQQLAVAENGGER